MAATATANVKSSNGERSWSSGSTINLTRKAKAQHPPAKAYRAVAELLDGGKISRDSIYRRFT
jgi:hypothetical protein